MRADPLVQAVLQKFPGAEIVTVRPRETDAGLAGAPGMSDDAGHFARCRPTTMNLLEDR